MANEAHLTQLKQGFLYLPLLVLLVVLLLTFVFWKLPQWYAASWDNLTDPTAVAKLESDTRATMVQAVGGLVLLVSLFFTWRNLRVTEQNSRQTLDLSRQGQINDRFTKAIEQLGAVAQEGKRKLEVLTAYVRENAPRKEEEQRLQEEISLRETPSTQSNQSPPKLATDIQAILTVLGRRTRMFGKGEEQHLDLARTDLRRANLGGAQLQGANLTEAQLQEVLLQVILRGRAPGGGDPPNS
jgi:Pentapeptide repeats (8 copies)